MRALKHTLAISFIYSYYKVGTHTRSLRDYTHIYLLSIYIYTYIRTHMNALACAYIDGINDRFAQSHQARLCLCCICVCMYVCICLHIHTCHFTVCNKYVHNLTCMYMFVYVHVCIKHRGMNHRAEK